MNLVDILTIVTILSNNIGSLTIMEKNLLDIMKEKLFADLPYFIGEYNKMQESVQKADKIIESADYAWKRLAELGEKLPAIKVYRNLRNVGLKEAKEDVEYYMKYKRERIVR